MGGDTRGDAGNTGNTTSDATQHVLDQLNARLTQDAQSAPQTRAGYGVAPIAANGFGDSHADPYKDSHTITGRAGYSVSGGLAPGGAGVATNKPGGEQPPNFIQAHQNDVRNPNQPYTPSPLGAQAQQQMSGRPGAPAGDPTEARIMADIAKRGQYMSGWTGVWGGIGAITAPPLSRLISKGADGLVDRTESGTFLNRTGHFWQDNFDVKKVGKGDFVKSASKVTEADAKFAELKETTRAATLKTGDEAAQTLAKERYELLSRTINENTVVDIRATSAARAANGGKALFSDSELEVIAARSEAGMLRASQEAAIVASLQKTPPSMWGTFKAGAIGVGVDILAVKADRMAAHAIGGDKALLHSWNTEQILAPTALAFGESIVGKSLVGKALLVAGTVALSRVIDGGTQAVGMGAPTAWNAPTGAMDGFDGFGIATGLAFAAATKNPYAKAGVVALGWGIPKLIHLAQDHGANNLVSTYENIKAKVADDHQTRSYNSLDNLVDASQALGHKQEDWLVSKIEQNRNTLGSQWGNMGPDQKVLAFRDDAGMSVGLGEDLLKEGTRIHKQGDAAYTLGGYEIDMGGRSMHYLISGKDSIERAAAMTQDIIKNNNDSSKPQVLINGKAPSQSEVDDLNRMDARVKTDLTKILVQKHDCQAVMDQIVKNIPSSSDEWRQTYILPTDRMIEHYIPRSAPAQVAETRQVLGKLYRDQAIAYMAFAQDKMNRGSDGGGAYTLLVDDPNNHQDIFPSGRQKNYNGAQGVLAMAIKMDPNNADLPELQQMWKGLVVKAAAKANVQLTDPNVNVLNYGGLAPHPAGQDHP